MSNKELCKKKLLKGLRKTQLLSLKRLSVIVAVVSNVLNLTVTHMFVIVAIRLLRALVKRELL